MFVRFNPLHSRTGSPSRNRATNYQITHPNQLPVFLIPGIFRNKVEMYALAGQLHNDYKGSRQIFIYSDHDNSTNLDGNDSADESTPNNPTLTIESDPILAAIDAIMPLNKPLPYLLIGYSDGGKKAVNAARQLQHAGYDAQVFTIDSISPTATSEYFADHFENFLHDLVSVLNYAAQLSGMKNYLTHESIDKRSAAYLAPESLLEQLASTLQNLNAETNYDAAKFARYVEEAKSLLPAEKANEVASLAKLKKMTALFTKTTLNKYKNIAGSKWENEASIVHEVNNAQLANCSHQSILAEANVAPLASVVKDFLNECITPEQLLRRQRDFYNEEYERASSNSASNGSRAETNSLSSNSRNSSSNSNPTPPSSPETSPSRRRSRDDNDTVKPAKTRERRGSVTMFAAKPKHHNSHSGSPRHGRK